MSYVLAYCADPNYAFGYNLDLTLYWQTPTGNWGANDPTAGTPTISNFWIFMPGDALTPGGYTGPFPNPTGNDRSQPLAPASFLVNWLTASNGAGPANIRCIASVGNYGGCENYVNYSDCQQPSQFTWGNQTNKYFQIASVRPWNPNPANSNFSYASHKFYHTLLGNIGSTGGSDSVGTYTDLAPSGSCPNAVIFTTAGVLEMTTTLPHGLRSGDRLTLPSFSSVTPFLVPVTGGNGATLSGTVSVTYGSTSVTFSGSQTIVNNQCYTFAADSTLQAYRVSTGGTGTTFTITPAYQGTTNAATTATQCAAITAFQCGRKHLGHGRQHVYFPGPRHGLDRLLGGDDLGDRRRLDRRLARRRQLLPQVHMGRRPHRPGVIAQHGVEPVHRRGRQHPASHAASRPVMGGDRQHLPVARQSREQLRLGRRGPVRDRNHRNDGQPDLGDLVEPVDVAARQHAQPADLDDRRNR